MAGPYDSFVGELLPGDDGWLPLDDAGNPSGPATKAPPPISVKACAVQANATVPLPANEHLLLSESGAELQPPLTNNTERRVGEPGAPPPATPAITTLTPASAVAAVDLALTILGSNLTGATGVDAGGTVITPTTASGTAVEVTIPAANMIEGTVNISVTTPAGTSNVLPLTVTPVARDTRGGPGRRN